MSNEQFGISFVLSGTQRVDIDFFEPPTLDDIKRLIAALELQRSFIAGDPINLDVRFSSDAPKGKTNDDCDREMTQRNAMQGLSDRAVTVEDSNQRSFKCLACDQRIGEQHLLGCERTKPPSGLCAVCGLAESHADHSAMNIAHGAHPFRTESLRVLKAHQPR